MEKMENQAKSEIENMGDVVGSETREHGMDPWVEIYRSENEDDDTMKLTDVMNIDGVGCIVRSTFMFEGEITMSQVFVPGVKLEDETIVKI